jgi:HlyD family secretion protein
MPTNRRQQIQRLVLPVIAGACFVFAVSAVIRPERTRADPPAPPPSAAAASAVAGIGTVEPQSELIAVAAELPGVVRQVLVRPGDRVSQGQPLFRLDTRAAEAALATARADAAAADAAARQAEVALADEQQRLALFEAVDDARALSADELERRRFGVRRAAASAAQARAAATAAAARARSAAVDLERLTVPAPITGRVFRVDVRPGEYAAAGPVASPLIAMGEDARLHVRAEFDEADAPRLNPQGRAYGVLRGQTGQRIALTLVRIEPQVVEKRALAGGSERVDTRVVEVLYAFDPAAHRAWLGQRMDVFVEAAPSATQAAATGAERGR